MSARSLVWNVLDTDATFKALVPQLWSATVAAGLSDKEPVPTLDEGMFGFVSWGAQLPVVSRATTRSMSLAVYDRPGSTLDVERALLRARRVLEAAGPLTDDSGTVIEIRWTGDTDDFYDPDYQAVQRTSNFQITLSGER